jgi:hypothetical protein
MEYVTTTGNGTRQRRRVFQTALGNLYRKTSEVAPIAVWASQDANIMAFSQ